MSYDQRLAERVREIFLDGPSVDEKAMFGGLAFMLEGKMCCGVLGEELVVRVGPEQADVALARPHARPMDFTGRPMKGYVYVAAAGCRNRKSLETWISMAVSYVSGLPRAKPRRSPARSRRARPQATVGARSEKGVRR